MSGPTKEELNDFINALQLSIKTKIVGVKARPNGSVEIVLADDARNDPQLRSFVAMLGCVFERSRRLLHISKELNIDWPKLISFLFVTRMARQNVETISRMGLHYDFLVAQGGTSQRVFDIDSVRGAADRLFAIVEKRKMTLRNLAEKTGLTQASLSKFKAGGDIRLSNLIKIAKALTVSLRIE